MRALKIVALVVLAYAALVAAFESTLGFFQPSGAGTLVITTTGADGRSRSRVVARLESGGQLYVAANHWPRAWYRRALANPRVSATLDGEPRDYLAVPVSGEEYERVDRDNRLGVTFRIMTGFPPRRFLRLDPR